MVDSTNPNEIPETHTLTAALGHCGSGPEAEQNATYLFIRVFTPMLHWGARQFGLNETTAEEIAHEAIGDTLIKLRNNQAGFENRKAFFA